MKRKLCILFAIALCAVSYARIVDRDAAGDVARKYLSAPATCVLEGKGASSATKGGSSSPAYYVFQGADGWVIIAGDDCALPVIAHGPGKFPSAEEMPDNMRFYIEGLADEILSARADKLVGDAKTKSLWANADSYKVLTKSGGSRVEPLTEDIKWNQNAPFNGKTPLDGGSRCPTGCVATATAIVMCYYKWPEYGKGTIPEYTTGTKHISMPAIDIDGYEYDWDNMPGTITSSSPDAVKDAVSTLMLHVGCAEKMDYNSDASGTTSPAVVKALTTYMSYKKSCVLLRKNYYSADEWFTMIKRELDAGRPLIYSARSSAAGHSMVCDGYDEDTRMISVNWGWGSGGRGWYLLTTMNGQTGGWPYDHDAVFGLEPDYDGSSSAYSALFFINFGNNVAHSSSYGLGFYPASECAGMARNDGPFSVKLREVYRETSTGNLPVEYKISLYGRDNEEKEQIGAGSFEFVSGEQYASTETSCEIKGDLMIGDKIKCRYSTGGEIWYPFGAWDGDYLPWSNPAVIAEFGAYDLDVINLPPNLKAGRILYPQVLGAGRKGIKSITWFFDGKELPSKYLSVQLEAGRHSIKAKVTFDGGTVKTIMTEFDVAE